MFIYIVEFKTEHDAEEAVKNISKTIGKVTHKGSKMYVRLFNTRHSIEAFKAFIVDCENFVGIDKEYADELKETIPNLFKEA